MLDNFNIVDLLGRSVYNEIFKIFFPKVILDNAFNLYSGNHLAIIDLKDEYGLKLYFDCTRHVSSDFLDKIDDSGVVLSVIHLLNPIYMGKVKLLGVCLWKLPYGLSFSDEREVVVRKVGRIPDDIINQDSKLTLEWEEKMYNISIVFDIAHQIIQSMTYTGRFIET